MDIETAVFTVLDLETAGFQPGQPARICEIGAIKSVNGVEQARFSSLINPEQSIDPECSKINKITDDMVQGKPTFKDVAEKVSEFLRGTIIIAHNTGFDVPILNAEFARVGLRPFRGGAVDTVRLARRAFPGIPGYGLDPLARFFGITFTERHRSIGDCEVTLRIFWECVRKLKTDAKIRGLLDLLQVGHNRAMERSL